MTKEELEKQTMGWKNNYILKLEKENAELKADNDARKFAMAMSEKVEKQLREENTKLRIEWQEQVQKATDEGYARTLQTIQLTKAKDLIRELSTCLENHPNNLFEYKLRKEAKQFLKGEATTELSNECHDCAKFDEMPKGLRCKTCDNGSRFQKKEIKEK